MYHPDVSVRVTMYSRPGCGLCDEAREVILAVREGRSAASGASRAAFDYDEIDISGDDALELEYGIRIPVVAVDGKELFEIAVDPDGLAAAVSR